MVDTTASVPCWIITPVVPVTSEPVLLRVVTVKAVPEAISETPVVDVILRLPGGVAVVPAVIVSVPMIARRPLWAAFAVFVASHDHT